MSEQGEKILDGLQDAVAGNFTRVTIKGQTWVREEKASLVDLLLYEAAEADFNLKLAKLQEFYGAATAPTVSIRAGHTKDCSVHRYGEDVGPCGCGIEERQARIDRALAAIAEATEDADEQRNEPV